MKRFTATEIWDKPWFQKLPCRVKCLWKYLCDRCDKCGVWDVNWELASFQIGEKVSAKDLQLLGNRTFMLTPEKLWLPTFCYFQQGILTETCRPHLPIIEELKRHGLYETYLLNPQDPLSGPPDRVAATLPARVLTTLPNTLPTRLPARVADTLVVIEESNLGGDRGGLGEKGDTAGASPSPPVDQEVQPAPEVRVLFHLNEKTGREFRICPAHMSLIRARLREVGGDVDGIKTMIDRQCARWRGTDQEEYLRPETLFGKRKFANYYDSRNAPVQTDMQLNGQPRERTLIEKETLKYLNKTQV